MGLLVPDDFALFSLANDEEREVVEALRDHLSDGWLVFPDVGITGERDRQLDVVIAHERDGLAVIEVKGHRVELRGGVFYSQHTRLDPQPDVQARENAYALRRLLRAAAPELANVRVEYAIAFPNTTAVRGSLPPGLFGPQVMTSSSLVDPAAAVDDLMTARWGNQPIGRDGLDAVVRTLRPDAVLEWDEGARARRARRRMDELCAQRVHALEPLDVNRKVLVTGGAGSGKTRLAAAWARRAVARGERVLLTCYNDPLGDDLVERLPPNDRLMVGSFFRVALALDGMAPLQIPEGADASWWDAVAVGHLHSHWPAITERFDVIIVDETQDFSPAWLAQLNQLLDHRGSRRLMFLADEAQGVFPRGFTLPSPDDGWTRCALVDNCRNTFDVASILYRHFDGAAPLGGPQSLEVRWRESDDLDATIELVGTEIDHIESEGYPAPSVLIATTTRTVRDHLRGAMAFVPWEQRHDHTYVCENVQRVKGLEFDFVVLVASEDVSDLLLYVGLSRAVVGFSLIAPRTVAVRLGLARDADS